MSWPSAKIVAYAASSSPSVRFAGKAPASIDGQTSWISIRGRRRLRRRRHAGADEIFVRGFTSSSWPLERRPAAPDLSCPAEGSGNRRSSSSTGSQPRGSRGGRCCPSGRPTGTGSPYWPQSVFAGSPACSRSPTRPSARRRSPRFASSTGTGSRTGSGFAGRSAVADQVRFEREWDALRAYAAERGVRLIGDVPIYVAPDRADQRAHPELFLSGVGRRRAARCAERLRPALAQPALRLAGAAAERLPLVDRAASGGTFELFDLVRVDHFRGFVSYWQVPAGDATARNGRWHRGPGAAVFRAAEAELGPLPRRRRGSRRDHAGRRRGSATSSGSRGCSCSSSRSIRDGATRTARRTTASTSSSTPARTTWTPRSAGGARSRSAQRAETGFDPADPAWSMIRAGARVEGPALDRAGAGRPPASAARRG